MQWFLDKIENIVNTVGALKKAGSLEQVDAELRSTKRQCELMKNLLSDATTENEIMYEVSRSLRLFLRQKFNRAMIIRRRSTRNWTACSTT